MDEDKKLAAKLRKDLGFPPDMPDDEVIKKARFVETGEGLTVFESKEAFLAAKKAGKI